MEVLLPVAEPLNRTPEQRVRARIRRTFSQRATGRRPNMKALEDQVLKLIKDYCAAPPDKKEEVYERGERQLIRSVK